MCGIVGYIGFRNSAEILLHSLRKLEYRGYDSAGIAIADEKIHLSKKAGFVEDLNPEFKGTMGIGHTRWATHGKPSDENAHPFVDCKGEFAIVHNGIIENYMELKEDLLEKGHKFSSETDSEVIVHLLEELYDGDFLSTFLKMVNMLRGSFAIVAIHRGERRIMGAKNESPLTIGLGDHENFLASDIPAFLDFTSRVLTLKDGEICEVTDDFVKIYDFSGKEIKRDAIFVDWSPEAAEKAGYPHFMLKEIFEEPMAMDQTLHGLLSQNPQISWDFDTINIVACGTSYHAGYAGKYMIEKYLHIPVSVHFASEYRYRDKVRENPLVIFITQSGETADTLAAARMAKKMGYPTLGITNVVGSSITNIVDSVIYTSAGPEIGVAATKTFTSQVLSLYYLAYRFAIEINGMSEGELKDKINALRTLPNKIEKILEMNERIRNIADEIMNRKDMFYIGRKINYPTAMEGALKMKEISYIHAEAYPAGELKHGPLALIDNGVPVIALVPEDDTYAKMIGNIKEVSARGAKVIAISTSRDVEKYVDVIIRIPKIHEELFIFPATVVLQLLAYHTADLLGREIDKPKNLAKSVTVE